jgi:hypothetical protein
MGFRPDTILLLDIGKYSRNRDGTPKKNPNSVAQLPFIYKDGMDYLQFLLSSDKREKYGLEIPEESLLYIEDVRDAVAEFPPMFKCQGFGKDCGKYASRFALPYSNDMNNQRRIDAGGPKWIKQTHINAGQFLCNQCSGDFYADKCMAYVIPIGLSVPMELRKKKKSDVNFSTGNFHGMIKFAVSHIPDFPLGKMIDTRDFPPRNRNAKAPSISIERAQKIMTRLCGLPESRLPSEGREYFFESIKHYSGRDEVEQIELFQ